MPSSGWTDAPNQIAGFWARFFGVTVSSLNGEGIRVVPHVGLGTYTGIWAFELHDLILISTPSHLQSRIHRILHGCRSKLDVVTSKLRDAFSGDVRVVGPAFHGYTTTESFQPSGSGSAVEITRKQALQIDHSGDDSAWNDSGLGESGIAIRFGMLDGSSIVAASGCRYLDEAVASIGFYTTPSYRRRGAGSAVLSAAVSYVLGQGHGIEFQTLDSNAAAVRSATRVGITRFATHVAIAPPSRADTLRLKE